MLGVDDAFLLGYLPAVAVTPFVTLGLVDKASQAADPDGKIARVTSFARDAVRGAKGEPLAAAARLRDVAARTGVDAAAPPVSAADAKAWLARVRAAAARRVDDDDDRAGAAFAAGCAAGDVYLHMWSARTVVYIRIDVPQVLRPDVDDLVARLDDGVERLAALGLELDARPDVAGVRDAAGLRAFYEWARDAGERLIALARSLMAAAEPPAVTGPPTAEERRLRGEVIARPDDEAPRVRLAELAARRHDPLADLIDTQLTLRDLRKGGAPVTVERSALMKHASELIDAHPAWSDPVLEAGAEAVRFHGGFVEEITCSLDVFLAHAEALYAAAPIRHLRLRGVAGRAGELAASPHLARIVSLDLEEDGVSDVDVAALAASPHVRGLRWLELSRNRITDAGVDALASSPNLRTLAYCGVQLNPCANPTDTKVWFDDTRFGWEPTPRGRELEANQGRIEWLHPRGETWPPDVDQV